MQSISRAMRNWWGAAPLLIPAMLVLAVLIRRVWGFTIDDAFITFRYARNWVEGFGPTYNPGGEPAEGYTTFLWMLLMTLPHLLRLDVVPVAKIAGIAAMLGCGGVIFAFTAYLLRDLAVKPRTVIAAGAVLLFAITPATAVHAISGMETALFTLLLVLFLFLLTRTVDDNLNTQNIKLDIYLAFVALLLGLCRPEGNIAVWVGLATALVLLPAARRRSLLMTFTTGYFLPGALYYFWRVYYYGLPFPLPFYVKVAAPGTLAGLPAVRQFIAFPLSLLVPGLSTALPDIRRPLLPALLAVAALLAFFLLPAPIMNYDFRYLFPLLPMTVIVAMLGVGNVWRWCGLRWAVAVGIIMITLYAAIVIRKLPEVVRSKDDYRAGLASAHLALAHDLAAMPAGTLAIEDAGAVPYYSGWRVIDIYGLNDPHVARHGRDPAYVLAQHPDLVVLISTDESTFRSRHAWVRALYRACTDAGMTPCARYTFRQGAYYLWVMEKVAGIRIQESGVRSQNSE